MEGSVPWKAVLSKNLVCLSYCRTNQWDAATMLEICFSLIVRFFKIKQQFFSTPTWASINQLQEFCSLERLVMVAGPNFLLWKLSHIFGEYIHPWNADELPNISIRGPGHPKLFRNDIGSRMERKELLCLALLELKSTDKIKFCTGKKSCQQQKSTKLTSLKAKLVSKLCPGTDPMTRRCRATCVAKSWYENTWGNVPSRACCHKAIFSIVHFRLVKSVKNTMLWKSQVHL